MLDLYERVALYLTDVLIVQAHMRRGIARVGPGDGVYPVPAREVAERAEELLELVGIGAAGARHGVGESQYRVVVLGGCVRRWRLRAAVEADFAVPSLVIRRELRRVEHPLRHIGRVGALGVSVWDRAAELSYERCGRDDRRRAVGRLLLQLR